jgi:hypothetical protein
MQLTGSHTPDEIWCHIAEILRESDDDTRMCYKRSLECIWKLRKDCSKYHITYFPSLYFSNLALIFQIMLHRSALNRSYKICNICHYVFSMESFVSSTPMCARYGFRAVLVLAPVRKFSHALLNCNFIKLLVTITQLVNYFTRNSSKFLLLLLSFGHERLICMKMRYLTFMY